MDSFKSVWTTKIDGPSERTQQPGAAHGGESPRLVEAIPAPDGESSKSSPRSEFSTKERYFQMWQQYSREVSCSNSAELDFKVGRRAFEAGGSQKRDCPDAGGGESDCKADDAGAEKIAGYEVCEPSGSAKLSGYEKAHTVEIGS